MGLPGRPFEYQGPPNMRRSRTVRIPGARDGVVRPQPEVVASLGGRRCRRRMPGGRLPGAHARLTPRARRPGRAAAHHRGGVRQPLRPGMEQTGARGPGLRPAQPHRRVGRGPPGGPREPGRIRRGGGHRARYDAGADRPARQGRVRVQVRARRRRRRHRADRPHRQGPRRPGRGSGQRARPDPAGARLPEVGGQRPVRRRTADHDPAGRGRPRRSRRRPHRLAAGAPGVRAAGRRVRRLRRRRRRDQRHRRRAARRGARQALHRLPPGRVRAVARRVGCGPARPGGRTGEGGHRAARRLGADPDGPGPAGAAGARDPGEHRAVRADRPYRLRQRQQPRHRPRQPGRHGAGHVPAAPAAGHPVRRPDRSGERVEAGGHDPRRLRPRRYLDTARQARPPAARGRRRGPR